MTRIYILGELEPRHVDAAIVLGQTLEEDVVYLDGTEIGDSVLSMIVPLTDRAKAAIAQLRRSHPEWMGAQTMACVQASTDIIIPT